MRFRKAILLTSLAELIIVAIAVLSKGISIEALQTITNYSGKFSLIVFSIFLIAHSRRTNWLSDKPYTVFAFVHGIHLAELICYVYLANRTLIPYRVAGGFIAYLMIFMMPLLQYYYQAGKVSGKQFGVAELVFQTYVWLIFFITYLTRYLGKVPGIVGHQWDQVILLGWVFVLLVITKGAALLSTAKKATS